MRIDAGSGAARTAAAGAALVRRVHALEAAFRLIQATRMQGLGLLNERLRVQAVGFELLPMLPAPEGPLAVAGGVLVTPWFINLMLLPLGRAEAAARTQAASRDAWPAPGQAWVRAWGGHPLSFIGAHDVSIGAYALCSLCSPVHDVPDQAAAVATAQQVLDRLRLEAPAATGVQAPARRGFLFGRSALADRP
jgi:[NiFe] hydrogenase assembly HybE family chaperone